jgi:hypothetical protein
MRRQFSEARYGQFFAFLISAMFLIIGSYVAVSGQSWVGALLGTMGISGIAANFLRGRRASDEVEKSPITPPQSKTKGKSRG